MTITGSANKMDEDSNISSSGETITVDDENNFKVNGKVVVPYFHTIQKMVLYETKTVRSKNMNHKSYKDVTNVTHNQLVANFRNSTWLGQINPSQNFVC